MTRRNALIDVCWVLGAVVSYLCLEVIGLPKRWSYLATGVLLVAFAIYARHRGTDTWQDLGFRRDNLVAGLRPVGLFTLSGAALMIAWAWCVGRPAWGSQAALLLVLYPVWAVVQQTAFQGFLHRKLMVLVPSRFLQVFITAAAFAIVHAGSTVLVGLTFLAGIAWSLLYRRYPNLWLIGASHTILASLVYPTVLADAPLQRF